MIFVRSLLESIPTNGVAIKYPIWNILHHFYKYYSLREYYGDLNVWETDFDFIL